MNEKTRNEQCSRRERIGMPSPNVLKVENTQKFEKRIEQLAVAKERKMSYGAYSKTEFQKNQQLGIQVGAMEALCYDTTEKLAEVTIREAFEKGYNFVINRINKGDDPTVFLENADKPKSR